MTGKRCIRIVLKTGEERLFDYEKFNMRIDADVIRVYKESNKENVLIVFASNVSYIDMRYFVMYAGEGKSEEVR